MEGKEEICNELERISNEENVGDYVSSFLKFVKKRIEEEEERPKLNFDLPPDVMHEKYMKLCKSHDYCDSCPLKEKIIKLGYPGNGNDNCFYTFLKSEQSENFS